MKYIKILLILIAFLIPNVSLAAFDVGWNATSTTQGWIWPNLVNGVVQKVAAYNFIASFFTSTSTTQTNTFPLANITKLSNLTSNGFVKTGSSDGTLSVDTTTYESGLTAGDGLTRTVNDFDCDTASGSTFGCLSSTDWTTFNNKQASGNYITALTGDVTASGPGSAAATLATVNSDVGTYTNANITVNAKGLITAASNGTAGGGGSGGGTWSTTTSTVSGTLVNYPNNTSDVVLVGSNASSSAEFYFDPNTNTSRLGLDSGFLGGAVYTNGLFDTKTQLMLTGSVNDLQSNMVVGNTYSGADGVYATGGITYVNASSTVGDTFQTSTNYCYHGLAGPKFAAFSGLPANGYVQNCTDGPQIFGATSGTTTLGWLAWAIGSGYLVANYDMVLKNVDTAGSSNTASGGLGIGTTTPTARLSLSASSTATFDYMNVYQHVNGVTNSVPVFNVNKNENIGIASTTPWARLSVNPNLVAGPSFAVGSSTKTDLIVTSDGNVGVGLTNPSANLTIGNNLATNFLDTFAEYQLLLYTAANAGASYGLGVSTGNLVFNSGSGGFLFDSGAANNFLAIDSNGDVGIGGNSSPAFKVTVGIPSVAISNFLSAATGAIVTSYSANATMFAGEFTGASGASGGAFATLHQNDGAALASGDRIGGFQFGGYDGVTSSNSAAVVAFATGNWSNTSHPTELRTETTPSGSITRAVRTTLTSGGLFGIATTSPWRTLSVAGTVAFNGLTSSTAGNAVCILTTFDVVNAGNTTCATSARNTKKNIEDLSTDEVKTILMGLKPVAFNYKESGERRVGFIAEDVAKVDTRLVEYAKDDINFEAIGVKIKKGSPISVQYANLTSILTKFTQGFYKEFQAIVARVSGLEKKVADQEKRIEALEKKLNNIK